MPPGQRRVQPVLPDHVERVAVGQEDPHHDPVRALAERFLSDDRRATPAPVRRARGEQPLGDGLQGLQPQLAVLLALDQHPLVVPVGQKLGAEQLPVRIEPAAGVVDGAVQVVVAERLRPSEIDVDRRMQRDVPVSGLDQLPPGQMQAPDRRPQIGDGPLLRGVEPEHPGDVEPPGRPGAQGQEREQAAGRHRQRHRRAVAAQLEPAQQPQLDRRQAGLTGRRAEPAVTDRVVQVSLPNGAAHAPYETFIERSQ